MKNYKLDFDRTEEDRNIQNDFTAYLMKAVKNTRLKYLMNQERVQLYEVPYPDEAFGSTPFEEVEEPATDLLDSLENMSLFAALRSVSEKELIIVKLHVLYGMKFGSIGMILDMPEATARSTYNRTIEKIRKRMEFSN